MRHSFRRKYTLPITAAVALVGVIVWMSIYSTRSNLAHFSGMMRSREMLRDLGELGAALKDAETGQRGYLITGNPEYLGPYRGAREEVDTCLVRLQMRGGGDPVISAHLGNVRILSRRKFEEMEETLRIRETLGFSAAQDQVKSEHGRELMQRLDRETEVMKGHLQATVADRQAQAVRSLKRTNLAIVVCGILALVGGGVFLWMFLLYRKNREDQIQLSIDKDTAQKADRAKSEFLAVMSHEIRTPMNAILGFGELLRDSAPTSRDRKFAEAILTSGNALLTLINDVLDISKIEAGQMEIHAEPVAVSTVANNLEMLFSFAASEKQVGYHVSVDPSVPDALVFDSLRVRQVLLNLVGNALKFTSEGAVHVTIGPFRSVGNQGRGILSLTVEDTGIGIPENRIEQIFRPFVQADSRRSRKFEGTGLGLAISRRLASIMGGVLTVKSQVGQGSIFRLDLPTQTADAPPAEEVATPVNFDSFVPARIWVVGQELDREVIMGFLYTSAHQVFEAENEDELVALWDEGVPDLVVMDVQGRIPFAKEFFLRSEDAQARKVPVVALSMYATMQEEKEIKSAFDGFLRKPLTRSALHAAFSRILPAVEPAVSKRSSLHRYRAKSEWKFEDAPPARWHSLLEQMRGPLAQEAARLSTTVPVQATLDFARRLETLARPGEPLEAFALDLRAHLETFETDAVASLLRSFSDLAASLAADLAAHCPP